MPQDSSPLDTLRQLKEWLDAGTITPQEFDTLKRKLLFSEAQTTPPAAAPHEEHVVPGPIEDPGLPTYVESPPTPVPPVAEVPPVRATPAEFFTHPTEIGRPDESPSRQPDFLASPPPPEPAEAVYEEPAPAPRNPLMLILIIGGIVALLGLIAYLAIGNRDSERLSSTTMTAADSLAVQPEEGPQTEQIVLDPAAAPETVRVAPVLPPAAPVDSAASAPAPAATETTPTAAPASADDNAVRSQVQSALTAYYEDLKAAPFDAATHFAPQVERFYTQQNTTPAAINEELAKSHFPEFTEAETTIEPGSLQVGPVTEDGSRMITYREKSRAFRQSKQQHQQTTAQVRVRLDKNFKITYLRQERLLENVFSE
ncbi:SHOCT domain-containing protein [Hymenobacter lutimineralis]|uniref:SHOCT domain-containing protein n=1 Tax=Hymenobacter lutimineralis TaxID=2606448 RepID=A0A5D6V3N1_9BACT|nr:SHOCT domain-containing protein [Hymenobacter lutimineralis]TYZ09652.1 SHOCT domain-containing protein [Hymenobacter lutimineralis]